MVDLVAWSVQCLSLCLRMWMYLLGMRFENGLVWHNNGLSCLLCFVLVMSNRLQSSPENYPNDPLMSGTGNRPTRQYGQKIRQEMSHIDFMLRTNPPVVSSHQDRVAWDHDGWAAMSDSMQDRLIRNLLILIGSSRMNTSANHTGIAETVMI